MKTIRPELTNEQIRGVLSLAAEIEHLAAKLNLSMRNHASPITSRSSQSVFGVGYTGSQPRFARPAINRP